MWLSITALSRTVDLIKDLKFGASTNPGISNEYRLFGLSSVRQTCADQLAYSGRHFGFMIQRSTSLNVL